MPILKDLVSRIFASAGIKINGPEPWDIQVKNPSFYSRVLRQGSLGLGEAYMDGWWDVEDLEGFFFRVIDSGLAKKARFDPVTILGFLVAVFSNQQKPSKAFEIGEKHYDVGNDLYSLMLDRLMTYSCGYFKNAQNLDEAQEAKLDLICRKLRLKAGERVLDIGGGWGSFARYAAENYGVNVDVITVSKEQFELGKKLCANLPVAFYLQDYRDLGRNGKYNKIVSVGMIEHVGYKNYREYFEIAKQALLPEGLFLLHTIGGQKSVRSGDPWIEKYIFTNSMLPSKNQLKRACQGIFKIHDWHEFGAYYHPTIMAWFSNFNRYWPRLEEKYGKRFYRMWKYYLLSCAASFRAGKNQVWQILLSDPELNEEYETLR